MRIAPALVCLTVLLAGCTSAATLREPPAALPPDPVTAAPPPEASYPGETTRILSDLDAQRLLNARGVTLQWIDWNTRGSVAVSRNAGLWSLRGAQAQADGPGRLYLDGTITEIGEGYFTFDGVIRITDTPDPHRACEKNKTWHFAVTQNRPYYRLREFEWCDGLTDYVDIYF